MNDLKVLEAFQDRPVAYYRVLTELTGSVSAGVLLSQIVYWDGAVRHSEFYKTDKDFCEELGMGRKELMNAKKKLAQFVMIVKKGLPAKTWYKLDVDALIHAIVNRGDDEEKEVKPIRASFAKKKPTKKKRKQSYQLSPKGTTISPQKVQLEVPKSDNKISPKGTEIDDQTAQQYKGTENTTIISSNEDIPQSGTEKKEYGNEDINKMIGYLKKEIGLESFIEASQKTRYIATHCLNLGKKIGPNNFDTRLKSILQDKYKMAKCNSIVYVYQQIKGFIIPKETPNQSENEQRYTNATRM